jgi:hypothetical protein
MKRAKIFAAVIYAMLVVGTMTFVHFPDLQADEADARITAEQAKTAALRVVPGTVKDSEFEKEHGRLIYSVEIAPAGERGSFFGIEPLRNRGIVEVNVSAMDGSIVNVHREHGRKHRKPLQRENVRSASVPYLDLL